MRRGRGFGRSWVVAGVLDVEPLKKWFAQLRSLNSLDIEGSSRAARIGRDFYRPWIEHGAEECGRVAGGLHDGRWDDPIDALDLLVQRGSYVPPSVVYDVLKGCMAKRDVAMGRRAHALALQSGYESNTFLANHLIRMYASQGTLQEATQVFTRLPAPDAFVWASIISAHSECGQATKAISLYHEMQQSSTMGDDYVTVAVLKACANAVDLASGKQVHADILKSGVKPNTFVGNCLMDMYTKCGSLEAARRVFDALPTRDVVAWTAMIAGYAQHGFGNEALRLYARMQQEGITPTDRVTFVCLLKACACAGALIEGKQLHFQIQQRGLAEDLMVGNCLVDMYAKCGSLVDARNVFDSLPVRNVVTWTAIIAGYAQHGRGEEALSLHMSMQQEGGTMPNSFTLVCLLKACAAIGALHEGKKLHSLIQEQGLESDVVVGTSLVDMYAKCGSLEDARRVFQMLPTKNVVTWTAMISACTHHGLAQEAITLYAGMQQGGIEPANAVTFVSLLKACASVGALCDGREMHSQIRKRGLESDVVVANSLVDMYAKCGNLEGARLVFDRLRTKDIVTWNTMIAGYVQNGDGQEALRLYRCMQQEGISPADGVTFVCLLKACATAGALPEAKELQIQIQKSGLESDVIVANGLVDVYAKCGSLEDARTVFERMPIKDIVTWNALISGYLQHGLAHESLALYARMEVEAITQADHVTFMCLLKACASIGGLNQGKQLHARIQDAGLEGDVMVGSCLVDMYAKCGSLEDARRAFDRLPTRDVVTWNALLNGCSQHGGGRLAVQWFQEMQQQGVEPDEATFTCLLVACTRQGLVDEGFQLFNSMLTNHGVAPNAYHLNCLVDLLARAGRVGEAENLLRSMPVQDNVVGWTSLLTACRTFGDLDRGQRCFNILTTMQPDHVPAYTLMANSFADAGLWQDVARMESLRITVCAFKKPARAWIELNSKVHAFTVGEVRDDICSKLSSVNLRIKQLGGHVPRTNLVLKPASDAEKEDALCGHAEKLALAYGLLNTPDGSSLLVTKNLRMCDDCHSGTKVLSKIENREIIVRDARRVHRFVDGVCSCGDRH